MADKGIEKKCTDAEGIFYIFHGPTPWCLFEKNGSSIETTLPKSFHMNEAFFEDVRAGRGVKMSVFFSLAFILSGE